MDITDELFIEESKLFTDEEIVLFCDTIKDGNRKIHPPIVPGMQIFANAASKLSFTKKDLLKRGEYITVNFGGMLLSGETATIGFKQHDEDTQLYSMKNGKDLFATPEQHSKVSKMGDQYAFNLPDRGIERVVSFTEEQLAKFEEIVLPENISRGKQDMAYLFSIAYASYALTKCVTEPESDIEWKLCEETMKRKPHYPGYTYLKVKRNVKSNKMIAPGDLSFLTYISPPIKQGIFETEKPKDEEERNYEARVLCSQDNHLIYSAIFGLTMIPEGLIKRILRKKK